MRIQRSVPGAAASPVALTIGNFDGVHLGHQAMLARLRVAAAERGLAPWVMTFEPHPREFFAPDQAPARLTSLREKLDLLAAHGMQGAQVCRFDYALAQTAPEDFIARILVRGLAARWILVGDDFRFGARRAGDFALLKREAARYGYDVEAMSSVLNAGERVSSTAVRTALAAGRLERRRRRRPAVLNPIFPGGSSACRFFPPHRRWKSHETVPQARCLFALTAYRARRARTAV